MQIKQVFKKVVLKIYKERLKGEIIAVVDVDCVLHDGVSRFWVDR